MEYRILGRTGLNISPICFGAGNFAEPTPEKEAKKMICRAEDNGINLLDTGDVYADGEGERIIGRALKEEGLHQRMLISTKVLPDQLFKGLEYKSPDTTLIIAITPDSRLSKRAKLL